MRPLNKGFYFGSFLGSLVVSLVLGVVLATMVAAENEVGIAICVGIILMTAVYEAIVFVVMIHKMWSGLKGVGGRLSPGEAVGLLFVPLFNLYWIYRALWGFAKEYNSFAARSGSPSRVIPEAPLLAYCILTPLLWIPYLGVVLAVVREMLLLSVLGPLVDAVNGLPGVGDAMARVWCEPAWPYREGEVVV